MIVRMPEAGLILRMPEASLIIRMPEAGLIVRMPEAGFYYFWWTNTCTLFLASTVFLPTLHETLPCNCFIEVYV